ncbi:MAG TPA: hypothetical protein VGN95_09580 [Pyrinomonadaceae bacterium]|jgi:hypothetical protein|nr:hypothetical protein [Pyrinomonadaceae bacterium]
MKSYLVTYDLIKRKDYPELFKALGAYGTTWHCLGSVWIIKSDLTAYQIYDALRPHIDDDDKLVVILLQREAKWTLSFSTECQDWLQKYL